MRHFNIKDRSKINRHLGNLTEKVSKKSIKVGEHAYRNQPHLILDLYACSTETNKKSFSEFLWEMPKKIGMKILAPSALNKNGGLIFIVESHISAYSIDKGIVTMDVFSCRPFDVKYATNYALDYFKPMTFQIELLYRNKS